MSNDDVIGSDDLGSSDSARGPWYPRTQRRFRTDRPVNQDILVMVLVEYTWEQNSAGQVRNTVGRVLTESGWREFESYAMMAPDMPTISGLDMVRQMALDKKLEQWERWIASMIDFGNQSELAQQEQQEHQNPQDDEDGGQRIVSHDRPVPTPVPDETPEATPADNQQPERTVTDD